MTDANRVITPSALDADTRWAVWVTKGLEHDRITRTRAFATLVLLGIGLAGWLLAAWLR